MFALMPMIRRQFLVMLTLQLGVLISVGNGAELTDLVFTQYPHNAIEAQSSEQPYFLPADKYVNGARIVRLNRSNPESRPKNLTPGFASACDPDISFDGESIVFAGKKDPGGTWQIWRMAADGSNPTQLTDEPGNCVSPVHAGARFFLDDPEPVIQIIYAGDSHGWKNEMNDKPAYSIYAVDLTGDRIHRLSFNMNADYEPTVLPNGRIIYSSWQRYGNRYDTNGITALLAINNDGTDLMPFYGNHQGPFYKSMPAVAADGTVYFIESDNPGILGGGDLSLTNKSRPLHSYSSRSSSGNYAAPSPLPDGSLLVSYREKGKNSPYAIYAMDTQKLSREAVIFQDSEWHSLDVQSLEPHPEPKGRSNWLIPGTETGVYYALDSYRSSLPVYQDLEKGSLKFVRVLEGLPQKSSQPVTSEFPSNFAPSRILGVFPLEKDGSFQFTLPANTPVTFQLLDEHRQAAATQQGWTWVMGNESRGCIGCHEDRELSPPNIFVDAVKKPPVDLTLPAAKRRTVDFKHQVMPIIRETCSASGCHGAEAQVIFEGRSAETVYTALLNSGSINPGSAKNSALSRHILGKSPDGTADGHSTGNISMKQSAQIQIIEWIDMGALWDVTPYLDNH